MRSKFQQIIQKCKHLDAREQPRVSKMVLEELEDKYSLSLLKVINQFSLDVDLVKQAMRFVKTYHKGQYRDNGAPFYSHPIAVAKLLLSQFPQKVSNHIIVGALLHDVVEDTDATITMIKNQFGNKVAAIVDLLTRVTIYDTKTTIEEVMLKLFQASCTDGILIKICDRLHNLLTSQYRSRKKKIKLFDETLGHFIVAAIYYRNKEVKEWIEQICCPRIPIYSENNITTIIRQTNGGKPINWNDYITVFQVFETLAQPTENIIQ